MEAHQARDSQRVGPLVHALLLRLHDMAVACIRGSSSSKFIIDDYSPRTALDVERVSTRAVIRYL